MKFDLFLSAEWRRLILLNFPVPSHVLEPYLPDGIILDAYQGSAYVSLVAFEFLNTKVMGIKWPGYINFPEFNLRFYVREGDRRGVVFVREFVPQKLTASIANVIYNEPYQAIPMRFKSCKINDDISVEHRLNLRGSIQKVDVEAVDQPDYPALNGMEDFFKEHEWGFGKDHSGKTIEYHVVHQRWRTYPVKKINFDFDWALAYGEQWRMMNGKKPASAILAEGSPVKVFRKGRLNR